MKRLALAASVLAIAAVAVWSPVAGSQISDVRVNCKGRAIDVYFWPHGHPAVKAYKFPAYPTPHLEVYNGNSFASKSFFVFVSAVSYNYANTCSLATNPLGTKWGGGPQKTVTATRRVQCKFPSLVQLKIIPGPTARTGYRFVVARGGSAKELLSSKIKAKGSSLTYDSRYCTASKVPGVR
jgi:hypothetical protein